MTDCITQPYYTDHRFDADGSTSQIPLASSCNNIPCPRGWSQRERSSDASGRQCGCVVSDYEAALTMVYPYTDEPDKHPPGSYWQGIVPERTLKEFKLGCCNGSGIDEGPWIDYTGKTQYMNKPFDKNMVCSSEWCPKSKTDKCDGVLSTWCERNNSENYSTDGCKTYCDIIPDNNSTLARKEIEGTWCYDAIGAYCSQGDRIITDKICTQGYSFTRPNADIGPNPVRPEWADLQMETFCLSQKNQPGADQKYPECSCFWSDIPYKECIDKGCNNERAYLSNNMIRNKDDCKGACIQIIDASKAGKDVKIDKNIFNLNCGKFGNRYTCDDNKCVPVEGDEIGEYIDDPTCSNECDKSPLSPSKPVKPVKPVDPSKPVNPPKPSKPLFPSIDDIIKVLFSPKNKAIFGGIAVLIILIILILLILKYRK